MDRNPAYDGPMGIFEGYDGYPDPEVINKAYALLAKERDRLEGLVDLYGAKHSKAATDEFFAQYQNIPQGIWAANLLLEDQEAIEELAEQIADIVDPELIVQSWLALKVHVLLKEGA